MEGMSALDPDSLYSVYVRAGSAARAALLRSSRRVRRAILSRVRAATYTFAPDLHDGDVSRRFGLADGDALRPRALALADLPCFEHDADAAAVAGALGAAGGAGAGGQGWLSGVRELELLEFEREGAALVEAVLALRALAPLERLRASSDAMPSVALLLQTCGLLRGAHAATLTRLAVSDSASLDREDPLGARALCACLRACPALRELEIGCAIRPALAREMRAHRSLARVTSSAFDVFEGGAMDALGDSDDSSDADGALDEALWRDWATAVAPARPRSGRWSWCSTWAGAAAACARRPACSARRSSRSRARTACRSTRAWACCGCPRPAARCG
jgi:hypothetical protein